jgi:hypothetical protein
MGWWVIRDHGWCRRSRAWHHNEATRGTIVVAAWGKNPRRTAGVGRGATGGSNPEGTFEAGRQDTMVEGPTWVSWVPMVKTIEPNSQRKSRSVRFGEAARGKLSPSKTRCRETIRQFVERSRQR